MIENEISNGFSRDLEIIENYLYYNGENYKEGFAKEMQEKIKTAKCNKIINNNGKEIESFEDIIDSLNIENAGNLKEYYNKKIKNNKIGIFQKKIINNELTKIFQKFNPKDLENIKIALSNNEKCNKLLKKEKLNIILEAASIAIKKTQQRELI